MEDCKRLALTQFPDEMQLLGELDKNYYEMLKITGQITGQTYAQKANMALVIRNFRLLHCAYAETLNGYYEAAMTLLRSIYENALQMNYFTTNEQDAGEWLDGKIIDQKHVRDKLNIDSSFYRNLSREYAHSIDVICMRPLIFDVKPELASINHYPTPDPKYCQLCLSSWIIFGWYSMKQMLKPYKNDQISDKQWLNRHEQLEITVKQFSEQKGSAIAKELEKPKEATEKQQQQPKRST